jgi:5-methylcytosine-specific restriction endonuclease McrA
MSRTVHERINELFNKCSKCTDRHSFSYTQNQTYKLLLEIIDNKNDDEFYSFFDKHISNIKFKQYYFTRLFNPYRELNFNRLSNTKDFIDICCSPCSPNVINFYIELNMFLNEIVKINQKLKQEEQEKLELLKKEEDKKLELLQKEEQEKLELIKKEEEKKMKVIKKAIKKEVVKEVKKTSKQSKTDVNKSEKVKENITEDTDKKKKKKPISATIKRLVWNTNIGEDVGKSKCMCCNSTDITQMSFNCGHIVAEANGGETIVSNLKPICQNCNSSMGIKNMEDFMKSLK